VARDRLFVSYPPVLLSVAADRNGLANRGAPRIGIVGQVIEQKGHRDLLHALASIARDGRSFTIEVYGSGPEDEEVALRELSHTLGLQSRLRFHGFVADRASIYQNLDMVVVPSRYEEAFGLAAAEPGLAGLPVIASRAGGLPEVIVDGQTGLLFNRGDVSDLRSKLERLLVDPTLGTRLGAAARVRVRDLFSADGAVASVERALS
jgi:glycosyltransferase involved in cell wall biosynthesis